MRTSFDASFDPPAPIATVVIRNKETGERSKEIRMLLDTGADVSLLPATALREMNLDLSTGEKLDVVGFDGIQQSLETVETQIVLAEKRFAGVYCIIDSDLGILGRDILNQVIVVFDGPNLEWEIITSDDLRLPA